MHKIDGPGATAQNEFTGGDPLLGIPFTIVTAKWLNAVQRELVAIVERAGISLDDMDDSQVLQAINVLFQGAGSLKNLALNGNFRVWQETEPQVSIATTPRYCADMWEIVADGAVGAGGGSASLRTAVVGAWPADGSSPVGGSLEWFHLVASTDGGARIYTKIEDIDQFSGRTVTISFYYRVDAALGNVPIVVYQNDGMNPEATVDSDTIVINGDDEWHRAEVTFTLPALVGQASPHFLRIELQLPEALTFIWRMRMFQVEFSATATSFGDRPISLEESLCQRYLEKSYAIAQGGVSLPPGGTVYPGAATGHELAAAGLLQSLNTRFRVNKAKVPAVTWYAPDGTANAVEWAGGTVALVAQQHEGPSATGFPEIAPQGTTNAEVIAHWVADARL